MANNSKRLKTMQKKDDDKKQCIFHFDLKQGWQNCMQNVCLSEMKQKRQVESVLGEGNCRRTSSLCGQSPDMQKPTQPSDLRTSSNLTLF